MNFEAHTGMYALASPYPWFGSKRNVASQVWEAFGAVDNYIEPFFGSGAVLLRRPDFDPRVQIETINGRGRVNSQRERLWFSPHCSGPRQADFFDRQCLP